MIRIKAVTILRTSRKSHEVAKFCLLLLATVVALAILDINSHEPEHKFGSRTDLEPNQTLWKEMNDLPIERLNLSTPDVPKDAKLLILVVIAGSMQTVRQAIRDSWANPTNSEIIKLGKVRVLFLINQQDSDLSEEVMTYGDLLIVPGTESYTNLVYKELLGFRWAAHYYPEVDVAKVDSDVVLDVGQLHQIVKEEVHRKNIILGSLFYDSETRRDPDRRWYVPYSIYPLTILPTYASGPLYVISSSALRVILQRAPNHKVVEIEDLFFTGILTKDTIVTLVNTYDIRKIMPWFKPCTLDDTSLLIGFPVHGTQLTVQEGFERMKKMTCLWFIGRSIW